MSDQTRSSTADLLSDLRAKLDEHTFDGVASLIDTLERRVERLRSEINHERACRHEGHG